MEDRNGSSGSRNKKIAQTEDVAPDGVYAAMFIGALAFVVVMLGPLAWEAIIK